MSTYMQIFGISIQCRVWSHIANIYAESVPDAPPPA